MTSEDLAAPQSEAARKFLERVAPERDPWRCPLPDSGGEHDTYGGICHCGWSLNDPRQPGRALPPDTAELTATLVAIEREAAAELLDQNDRLRSALQETRPYVNAGIAPNALLVRIDQLLEEPRQRRDLNPQSIRTERERPAYTNSATSAQHEDHTND